MINLTSWRSYSLVISTVGINLTLLATLLVSTVGNRDVADFKFPQQIHFREGKAIAKKSKINPQLTETVTGEVIKARQKYQYLQDGRSLNLGISYLVGTRGDVSTYLQTYTSVAEEIIKTKSVKQIPGVGYHALFTDGDRAYLTSCISPRSPSNITQKQFSQHRYQQDLQLQVGLDWLRGKASIRDRRCLWILLSTPVTASDSQAAEEILSTAWKDIYQWWLPNFPQLIR